MQSSKFALFLGDLSMHCNEADLEEAFSPYGAILEIRVKRSKETAKTLSYGFLEFASASSAVNAMNDMDGAVLKGRPLRIRWAASKKNPVRKRDIREDLSDRISMHVKFMSYKIEKVITEELLRNLFSIYGEVSDTTIKQISIDRKSHRLKGYGFVSYFNDEAGFLAAQRALTELHDTTLDDITYKCELSNIIDANAPTGNNNANMNNNNNNLSPNGYPMPGMHGGPPMLGMGTPQSSGDFEFDVPAQQGSYYDDYHSGNGTPEVTFFSSTRSTFDSGGGGNAGGPVLSSATVTTNASMSASSSKYPSRTSSLEKDGLSPGALDFRTPTLNLDEPRMSMFPPPMGHYGQSPGRAAISASTLLSSYQTVGAPLSGGPTGAPRVPNAAAAPRPYHYAHQAPAPPQQGQYPSQVRYQPNRDPAYAAAQLQGHPGVAAGALYSTSPQSQARRSLSGSPQLPQWPSQHQQAQAQGQPRGPYGSPNLQQHQMPSPRTVQANFAAKYAENQQGLYNNNSNNINGLHAPPQQQQQPRYSPQQHYRVTPQQQLQAQQLAQQQQQQQAPVYPRYSPPTQYSQPTLSPSHLLQQQQISPHGQRSPSQQAFFPAQAPQSAPYQQLQQQQQQQAMHGLHGAHLQSGSNSPHGGSGQLQAQGQGQGQQSYGQVYQGGGGGYNPQSREFHPAAAGQNYGGGNNNNNNSAYDRHIQSAVNHPGFNSANSNVRPLYNNNGNNSLNNSNDEYGLEPSLIQGLGLTAADSLQNKALREDFFAPASGDKIVNHNSNSGGWFPPAADLPQM